MWVIIGIRWMSTCCQWCFRCNGWMPIFLGSVQRSFSLKQNNKKKCCIKMFAFFQLVCMIHVNISIRSLKKRSLQNYNITGIYLRSHRLGIFPPFHEQWMRNNRSEYFIIAISSFMTSLRYYDPINH